MRKTPFEGLTRRKILRHGIAVGGAALAGRTTLAHAQIAGDDIITPGQVLGPLYPVEKPADTDADLTLIKGRREHAAGDVVEISGRVATIDGTPIRNARIELWQANTHGRYSHPADTNPAPVDANFQGYASLQTDGDGRYTFRTIKPGAYPAGEDEMRAPHIHLDITGTRTRLVTQLYFPGEQLNATDRPLNFVPPERQHLLIARPSAERDGVRYLSWDVVLAAG